MNAPTRVVERERSATPAVIAPEPDAEAGLGARIAAVVALLALAVAVLSLPAGTLLRPGGFASLAGGPLEVREAGSWRALAAGAEIDDGASLRTVGDAATLTTGDGRIVLASGARAVVDDDRLLIERGSVLVDELAARTLVVEGVEATGQGTWRVDAGARPRLATYAGDLVVTDGNVEVALAPYRQVTARDREVGGVPVVPLRYLADDAFDREVMAEGLRVDELAAALGRSLTSTYGGDPRDLAFYASFVAVDDALAGQLPALAPVTNDDGADDRFGPPAEVLVAITVADAIVATTDTTMGESVAEVAELRELGAAWGLVLVAAGGDADGFNAAAARALEQAATDPPPVEEPPTPAEAAPAVATEGAGTPGGSTGGTGGGAGTDTGGNGSGGGGATAPAPPPPPSPEPDEADPPAPLAPVEDAVREVDGGLGDVVGETGELVEDVLGGVDELLDDTLGGLLGGG